MKKKAFFIFLISGMLMMCTLEAQNKIINLEQAVTKRSLYPTQMQNLAWMGTTEQYAYVVNDKLVRGNPAKKKQRYYTLIG